MMVSVGVLEALRFVAMLGLIATISWSSRTKGVKGDVGLRLILIGFILVFFGSLIDVLDDYAFLERYASVSQSEIGVFLEKGVGYLGGFLLLAVGFLLWLPKTRFLVQEVARRKETEKTLLEKEAALARAQHQASIGSWRWSVERGALVSCSEEYARIHGVGPEQVHDLLAHQMELVVHPDDRLRVETAYKRFDDEGIDYEIEYRIVRPDGQVRHVLEIGEPVFDESGRAVEQTGTIQDITEQKQVEDALRQSQKMDAIGQLTGGVAHDFNNLLAVVIGNTELLLRQFGEDNPRLQAVLRAARRGADLVKHMLAFSRKQPLQPRVLDLNALVQGMRDMLSRSLGETIEIKAVLQQGLWHAIADPVQVETALLIIGINARDAMPDGGALVIETSNARLGEADVKNDPELAPGDYVVLAVTDSGVGMPPEVAEHAFEPFFTTKDVGQGTGLGLSMVYGFAKQSDGHAAIYSEPDHGTTVRLYLPRTGAQAAAEAPGPAEEEAPRGRGETVLVVEDDADVREFAYDLLVDLGYRVVTADDAGAALGFLERNPRPDLLLTDVVLPSGLNGPDLAKRALALYPGLKILLMSGYPADAAKNKGLLDSSEVLLNKPFSRIKIARALRKALA